MGNAYFRQAKFAGYRFQAKPDAVAAHEAAYLQSKQVETFAKPMRTIGPTRNRLLPMPTQETFCQCWKCLSVMTETTDATTQEIRCRYCRGPVEVLTVDGVPQ